MAKALAYEQIRDYINGEEGNGCKLLTTKEEFEEEKIKQEKANWNVKFKVQCKCGNSFLCNWNTFTSANKRQCTNCGHKLLGQLRKHNYNKVKNNIESIEGYKLLSEEYIGCDNKLKIQCSKGHKFEMSYYIFNNVGCRCPLCNGEEMRLKLQTPIEDIYKYINNQNYKFVEWIDEYQNAKSKFKLKCSEGHEFITNYDGFKICKHRCSICVSAKTRGIGHWNWKGGVSPLHKYLRHYINVWKQDSLKQYNYKCYFTKIRNKDLEVHHLRSFSDIFQETMITLDLPIREQLSEYTIEELKSIEDKCLELHYVYGLGVPLRRDIHMLFHHEYGYNSTTEEDFREFEQKYNSGEFDELSKIDEGMIK